MSFLAKMAEVGKRLFWETVNIITAHDKIEDYLVIQMAETLQIALKINALYALAAQSAVRRSLSSFWEMQSLRPLPICFIPYPALSASEKLRRVRRVVE